MTKIVYITCKDEKEALKIGKVLVKERLAACVNIVPRIKSIYRWKGKIVEDKESILLVKTISSKVKKLIEKVEELHSYEVPCIEIIDINDGNKEYLKWIKNELMD